MNPLAQHRVFAQSPYYRTKQLEVGPHLSSKHLLKTAHNGFLSATQVSSFMQNWRIGTPSTSLVARHLLLRAPTGVNTSGTALATRSISEAPVAGWLEAWNHAQSTRKCQKILNQPWASSVVSKLVQLLHKFWHEPQHEASGSGGCANHASTPCHTPTHPRPRTHTHAHAPPPPPHTQNPLSPNQLQQST